jgi:hypothetical protein
VLLTAECVPQNSYADDIMLNMTVWRKGFWRLLRLNEHLTRGRDPIGPVSSQKDTMHRSKPREDTAKRWTTTFGWGGHLFWKQPCETSISDLQNCEDVHSCRISPLVCSVFLG